MNSIDQIIDAITNAPCSKSAIKAALVPFLGKPGGSESRNFGSIPTDKLEVSTDEKGLIVTIRYWSGLKWSARGGYGSPSVEVNL